MATAIAVRNVPDDVHDELAARAARAGQPLQEHLRAQLIELARKPTAQDVVARARARVEPTGTRLPAPQILALRDRGRR